MADPADNTTFPGAYDPLPAIGPNDKQNEQGLEHDVVHDRANAIINALQELIGFGDTPAASSILGRLAAAAAPDAAPVPLDPGAAYACDAAHVGQYRVLTGAAAKTITVQEPLPASYEIHFDNRGTGAATFVGGAGAVLIPSAGGSLVMPQNGVATLKRLGENEYRIVGVLEPAA